VRALGHGGAEPRRGRQRQRWPACWRRPGWLRDGELPARTIRFCLFGGEEEGFAGSEAPMARITPRTEAIDFEMIGYTAARQDFPEELNRRARPPERGDFRPRSPTRPPRACWPRFAGHLDLAGGACR
jgi:Zn-dependent M28 family amino/carboxypeptidase